MNLLSSEDIGRIIDTYKGFLLDETRAPGEGKAAFLAAAMDNPKMIPVDLREKVEEGRGDLSMAEYLARHPGFVIEFARYRAA